MEHISSLNETAQVWKREAEGYCQSLIESETSQSTENKRDDSVQGNETEEWVDVESMGEDAVHCEINDTNKKNIGGRRDVYTEDTSNNCKMRGRKSVKNEIGSDGKWIIRTYTGYIVTIIVDPDRDRPEQFGSESAQFMWDSGTEINLKRLKHQIQTGEYLPDDAIVEVDPNPLKKRNNEIDFVVNVETEEQRREKVVKRQNHKINSLDSELKLLDLILSIQDCFAGEHNLKTALDLLNDVLNINFTPLMLKKHPFVVNTIFCLCNYDGSDLDSVNAKDIKNKAHDIYEKMQSVFVYPNNYSFETYFKEQSRFLWRIFGYDMESVYELVNDPTSKF